MSGTAARSAAVPGAAPRSRRNAAVMRLKVCASAQSSSATGSLRRQFRIGGFGRAWQVDLIDLPEHILHLERQQRGGRGAMYA